MPDQLHLSYRLRGFSGMNMLRHFEKALKMFPFSRLSQGQTVLRVTAVSITEPPLFEHGFEDPVDPRDLLEAAKQQTADDCAVEIDTRWDLWQYESDWKLAPARVVLWCFGPRWESREGLDLRIDFGIDTHFLPQTDLPNHVFMAQSNIRSLLHLVHELDNELAIESRMLHTDSGENFAAKVEEAIVPGNRHN